VAQFFTKVGGSFQQAVNAETVMWDRKQLYGEDAKVAAYVLSASRVLAILNLDSNTIGDEGAVAVADALKFNGVLTTLHLAANDIGDPGAIAVADALKVNMVFAHCDLRWNLFGRNVQELLTESVNNRRNFQLLI